MKNEITVYELFGLIKEGKLPKKIKYENNIYEFAYYDYLCILNDLEKRLCRILVNWKL